jgi:hypothetical protein
MRSNFTNFLTNRRTLWTIAIQLILTTVAAIVINTVTDSSISGTKRYAAYGVLILLTIATYIYLAYNNWKAEDAEWKKNRMNWFQSDSVKRISEQLGYIEKFHSSGNYFKLMLAHFRVMTEHNKFMKISDAHDAYWSLRALSMWDYFIYVFRAILRECMEGDEYLTISVIDFWTKDKPSTEIENEQVDISPLDKTNLFVTNYMKCVEANVESKRVILINEDKIRLGKTKLSEQCTSSDNDVEYYLNFKDIVSKYANPDFVHEKFNNFFYMASEAEYNELLKEDIPFALIHRKSYANKLCISTYIPNLHVPDTTQDKNSKWRSGKIAKIGFYICSDDRNETWKRMYSKFESLYYKDKREISKRKGLFCKPDELQKKIMMGYY